MKRSGKFIAVKQLRLREEELKQRGKVEQYLKEIVLLNHLDHPNIIKYYDCSSEGEKLHIYMELMPGGSISSMLQRFGGFDEALIRKFVL